MQITQASPSPVGGFLYVRPPFPSGRTSSGTGARTCPHWSYLDFTALGRQEEWEDSPDGYPQTPPYQWWNYHDAHGKAT